MRNKKHIMYTHSMCRFYVKSSDSAVAHGASQCLCHHRGPRGKAKREERNEWVRSKSLFGRIPPIYVTGRNLSIGGNTITEVCAAGCWRKARQRLKPFVHVFRGGREEGRWAAIIAAMYLEVCVQVSFTLNDSFA